MDLVLVVLWNNNGGLKMKNKFCPECKVEMKLYGKSINHWHCKECGRVWEIFVTGMIRED